MLSIYLDEDLFSSVIRINIDEEDESISNSRTVSHLKQNLKLLDHVYPKTKIDLLIVKASEFCPRLVQKLSNDLNIKPSFMFMRCPGLNFKYNIGEFDGVRTIMK